MNLLYTEIEEDLRASVRAVLERFPVERRRAVELGLLWMIKLGMLDWSAG